jgi:hypothetical protein
VSSAATLRVTFFTTLSTRSPPISFPKYPVFASSAWVAPRACSSFHRLQDSINALVVSMAHGLTNLPRFDDLDSLATLFISNATHVARLPSLQKLTKLCSLSIFRRNAMCCNGFLKGTCDLTDFQCMPRADEPPIPCEPARLPREDQQKLETIDAFVRSANLTTDIIDSEPTVESTDVACGGALFRSCQLGEGTGSALTDACKSSIATSLASTRPCGAARSSVASALRVIRSWKSGSAVELFEDMMCDV